MAPSYTTASGCLKGITSKLGALQAFTTILKAVP